MKKSTGFFFFFCCITIYASSKDVVYFLSRYSVYKYAIANKKLTMLSDKGSKVYDIMIDHNNVLYMIKKAKNPKEIYIKEKPLENTVIREIYIPTLTYAAKVLIAPSGKYFALIKHCFKGMTIATTVSFIDWKSLTTRHSFKYITDAENFYCFSADSRFFYWSKTERETLQGHIYKLDIVDKTNKEIMEANTVESFSSVLLPIRLYQFDNQIWISTPKNSVGYLNPNNTLTIPDKKVFLYKSRRCFSDLLGTWCYRTNTAPTLLFPHNSFNGGSPFLCKLSKSRKYIAFSLPGKFYIKNLDTNMYTLILKKHKVFYDANKIIWN